MHRFLLIILFLLNFAINVNGQDECPIKLIHIDKIGNRLTNKLKKEKLQICIRDSIIAIPIKQDTILFVNNFHGTIGFCMYPITYIDYGQNLNLNYFIRILYFKILDINDLSIEFLVTYRKIDKKNLKFIEQSYSEIVKINKNRILGFFESELIQRYDF